MQTRKFSADRNTLRRLAWIPPTEAIQLTAVGFQHGQIYAPRIEPKPVPSVGVGDGKIALRIEEEQ